MWISVLGWTWRDGSKGRAVNGLSGVAPMVYFHFFTAAPSSQLSWLGATLFITGIFFLFRFRLECGMRDVPQNIKLDFYSSNITS
jgi:hypothetical protein